VPRFYKPRVDTQIRNPPRLRGNPQTVGRIFFVPLRSIGASEGETKEKKKRKRKNKGRRETEFERFDDKVESESTRKRDPFEMRSEIDETHLTRHSHISRHQSGADDDSWGL